MHVVGTMRKSRICPPHRHVQEVYKHSASVASIESLTKIFTPSLLITKPICIRVSKDLQDHFFSNKCQEKFCLKKYMPHTRTCSILFENISGHLCSHENQSRFSIYLLVGVTATFLPKTKE